MVVPERPHQLKPNTMPTEQQPPAVPENLREGRQFWRHLVAHVEPDTLAAAVDALAEPGRTLLRLHLAEDQSIPVIAAARGCSERIIRERLGHALYRLHKSFYPEAHRFNAFDL